MQIRTSEAGLQLIREAESLRLKAYRDGGGVPTIGYGHTRGVKMGQTCSAVVAEQWLHEDVAVAEDTINTFLPAVVALRLPEHAWDALASFVFNLGAQAFRNPKTHTKTGIAKALEANDWPDVARQMRRWIYDNGEVQRGLVIRRDKEAALWLSAFEVAA